MNKNNTITAFLVGLVVILLGMAVVFNHQNNMGFKNDKHNSKNLPTLYLHGLNGSSNDMNGLLTVAQRNGGTGRLKVTINKQGNASYRGKLSAGDDQPLIQIMLENNKAPINEQVTWLTNVLTHLRKKYHYRNYNTVGLSSGAVVFFRVAAVNSKNKEVPQPKRMVSIAGPFNGILHMDDRANANKIYSNGKPLIMRPANQFYPGYEQLLKDAKHMNNGVQFMNIYGNLNNKTNSDGLVTTNSAESLKYLVAQKTDSYYQHLEITGRDASHNKLSDNQVVQRAANRFLFDNY